MIYFTTNQANCFLIFLFFGIISGIILNVFSIIFLKKFINLIKKHIFNCIFTIFFGILFIFLLTIFNFGIFSFSLLFAFLLGLTFPKFAFKKTFVFFENKWYNIFNKIFKRQKQTNEHKPKQS